MTRSLATAVAPRWEGAAATLVAGSTQAHLVRRCADVAELVGVVRAGLADLVLVSSDLRGLERDVVDAVREAGASVLALHPAADGDPDRARTLRRWGVRTVLDTDATPADLDGAVAGLSLDQDADGGHVRHDDVPGRGGHEGDERDSSAPPSDVLPGGSPGRRPLMAVVGTRADAESGALRRDADGGDDTDTSESADLPDGDSVGDGGVGDGVPEDPQRPPGVAEATVVVVWGPYGSPGRTTVAVNLAAELATPLQPTILVDADTYGASVAQSLAVLDEAPGIAAAARAADQDALDDEAVQRLAPELRPGLRVLTGLPRPDRWPELRDASLADVLDRCRRTARWVVVDVAPLVEQDEELSFDTAAPRRNGATLTALDAADVVLVVGAGDPVGLQRLVRALDRLPELTAARREVVVTRVRPGPVGPEPERRIRETLDRFAGIRRVHVVPDDRDGLDAAILHGRLLSEVRPGSAARSALVDLAEELGGDGGSRTSRRARRVRWRERARR